jgi:hypothetical protein
MALSHPVKAMAANASVSAGNKLRFIFASPLSVGNCIGLAVESERFCLEIMAGN